MSFFPNLMCYETLKFLTKGIALLLFFPTQLKGQKFSSSEINQWKHRANQVNIIRDHWGIPHVYGKTDADCVFGLMYAQCEDDFKRIESNYIDVLGRKAKTQNGQSVYDDLFMKLVLDSAAAIADYEKSPAWLKKLLDAFADGINFYLYKNPKVKPALLDRFEPWFPLMWTDGSISAIETGGLTSTDLEDFYEHKISTATSAVRESSEILDDGSNGFAIAPSKSESGNALLYINPHVSFYFRPEVHMISEEGLNAYGAVTWGQFFVYQGFNEHCGWMHTSSYADVADLYLEEILERKNGKFFYKYNNKYVPVVQKEIPIQFLKGDQLFTKKIKTYHTHHGPIMAKKNGKWVSVRANNRSMNALIQSWNRTKAKNFDEFKKNLELVSNSSNNTMYADDQGTIAYWHGNFIPKRDTSFDWDLPVDGTTTLTEWTGVHKIDETVHLYNPVSGWIQNCNSTPYTSSGSSSPQKGSYPFYMSTEPENFRAVNAIRLLSKEPFFTIDKLIIAGYNTYLAAFEEIVPALATAFEREKSNPRYTTLHDAVAILKNWNLCAADSSIATTLAISLGEKIQPVIAKIQVRDKYAGNTERFHQYAVSVQGSTLLDSLLSAVDGLKNRFGSWQIPWGDMNRYQRLTGDLKEIHDDNKPSLPVGMAASSWGCLPSFVSKYIKGRKKRYGYSGNSFICAVEFGKKVRAKSLLAGGLSSNPLSPHFGDQAEMYTKGKFKEVLFYKEDVLKNVERSYRPGE